MKDAKHFNAHKDTYEGLYPLQRAEKYNTEMRKLGVAEDGRTFLDQFRQLVSEVGNALGYMRMVRSGGLRAIADAAVFIPAMDAIPHLEKKVNPKAVREGEEFKDDDEDLLMAVEEEEEEEDEIKASEATVHSCRVVDKVIHHMNKKLAQGSDYFYMLQEAIAKKLKDPEKYGHLKHFSMIVPSICISHVEYMVRQKEQLVKKNKDGLFTDDGFALGCVFLLCLFGVLDNFESLHWFESVQKHYSTKLREMSASMAANKEKEKKNKKKTANDDNEDDDIKTMQLTFSMAEYALKEYQGLERCFTSCLVFFQRRIPDEEEEEEEEEEE
jgi:WASH complex subunit 7